MAGFPSIAGGITALFRVDGAKPPNALRNLYPSYGDASLRASLFAREAVANSWDAYWFSDHTHPELELEFRFRSLGVGQGRDFRRHLDLGALQNRIGDGPEQISRATAGLGTTDCLANSVEGEIRVLQLVERWGGGMPGQWDKSRSAMDRALISVGWANAGKGAGGSFGYGKAAVAQGSRINSLVAYSCFREDPKEPGVTRRLLGVTYWRPFDFEDEDFNGWALFGDHSGFLTRPLENEAADQMAERLGIEIRDPSTESELGTTFLIVDPAFDAADLEAALLVNWWPALLRTGSRTMRVIIDDRGTSREVVVDESHAELGPFVHSYKQALDVMEGRAGPTVIETEGPIEGDVATARIADATSTSWSALALTKVPAATGDTTSLVAYVRDPRMVITYAGLGNGDPVVRGCFIADPEINDSLRLTEPPEHDKWTKRKVWEHGDASDYARSRALQATIGSIVGRFRRREASDASDRVGWTPGFSEFLAVPGQAQGRKPPKERKKGAPRPKRPIYVHLVHQENHQQLAERPTRTVGEREATLRASGTVQFTLADWVSEDSVQAEFSIGAHVVEEGSIGDKRGDVIPVRVRAPIALVEVADGSTGYSVHRGSIERGKSLVFDVTTVDYSDEWSVALVFEATPITPIQEMPPNGK